MNRLKNLFRRQMGAVRVCIAVLIAALAGAEAGAQYPMYPALPDANKLVAGAWNNVFKNLCDDHLYKRDFASLYRLTYQEIYNNKTSPAPVAYYYMGACLELGMGGCETSRYKAKAHYDKGASLGDVNCKKRLQSIRTNGYWGASAENREAFARKHGRPAQPSPGPTPTPDPGHRHNGGNAICKSCNGSGVCSYCGGSGEYWVDAGTYVAGDRYVKKKCTVCNGSRRCTSCHGKGHF